MIHGIVVLAIPGTLACAGAVAGTWIVRALARRLKIVSHPNPIVSQHVRPVAYLGGMGVAIGIACGASAMAIGASDPESAGRSWWDGDRVTITVAGLLFLALGIIDDLVTFRPGRKFILQACVAGVAVAMGLSRTLTGLELADRALAWLWILTLVNAFNFTDVCDGLLAGLSAVMFTLQAAAYPSIAPLAIVAAGSCVGFLIFNAPPATIFLGDAGSHLLGFLAAAITFGGSPVDGVGAIEGTAQAALLVGVPLFELAFLTAVRLRKGLPVWKGSPDHFSLRMQAGGITRWQTVVIAWVFAGVLGTAGLVMAGAETSVQLAILGLIGIGALAAARVLLRWEVRRPSGAAIPIETVTGNAMEPGAE